MASLSYIFTDDGGFISGEAMIYNTSVSMPVNLTNLPLESGRSVTDNAVSAPITATVSGLSSNVIDSSKPTSTMTMIAQLRKNHTLLTLVTGAATYSDMAIVGVTAQESGSTGGSLPVSIRLQQVEFVDVEFNEISSDSVDSDSAAADMSSTVNTGITAPALDTLTSGGLSY